ncbi:Hypothetical Protein FCC1311_081582 [Hondaea fermentalgiana]|uniref:Uncharacterized protein n=1 Tax=Hondaea fermentalgiana TaxID=2315210 RepID=A0A2R5GTF4_9STRA|nr:Hypothetical Protein FCC1311_081582 [Hondaea fermentalgiana]|eukprot:GBG31933.1 Hypothetical Protein FCC1311_081582 [Hondaea fermentalgiana]
MGSVARQQEGTAAGSRAWGSERVDAEDFVLAVSAGGDDVEARHTSSRRETGPFENAHGSAQGWARENGDLDLTLSEARAIPSPAAGILHADERDVLDEVVRPELVEVGRRLSTHFQGRRNVSNQHDLNDHLAMWVMETGTFHAVKDRLTAISSGNAPLASAEIFQFIYLLFKMEAQGAPASVFLSEEVRSNALDAINLETFHRYLDSINDDAPPLFVPETPFPTEERLHFGPETSTQFPMGGSIEASKYMQERMALFSNFACKLCLSGSSVVSLDYEILGPAARAGFDRVLAARSVATGIVLSHEAYASSITDRSQVLRVLSRIAAYEEDETEEATSSSKPQVFLDTWSSQFHLAEHEAMQSLRCITRWKVPESGPMFDRWKVRWGQHEDTYDLRYASGCGETLAISVNDTRFAPDQWTALSERDISKPTHAPVANSIPAWPLPDDLFVEICSSGVHKTNVFPLAFGRTTNANVAMTLGALAFRLDDEASRPQSEVLPKCIQEAGSSVLAVTGDLQALIADIKSDNLPAETSLESLPLHDLQQLAKALGLPLSRGLEAAKLATVIKPFISGDLLRAGLIASLLRPIEAAPKQDAITRTNAIAALHHELVKCKLATRVLSPRRVGFVHAPGLRTHCTDLEGFVAFEATIAPSILPGVDAELPADSSAVLQRVFEAATAHATHVNDPFVSTTSASSSTSSSLSISRQDVSTSMDGVSATASTLPLHSGADESQDAEAAQGVDSAQENASMQLAAVDVALRKTPSALADDKFLFDRFGIFANVQLDPNATSFNEDVRHFHELVPRRADRCSILQRSASGVHNIFFVVVASSAQLDGREAAPSSNAWAQGQILRIVHVRIAPRLVVDLALTVGYVGEQYMAWALDSSAELPRDEDLNFLESKWGLAAGDVKMRRWQAIMAVSHPNVRRERNRAVQPVSRLSKPIRSIVPRAVEWCNQCAWLRDRIGEDATLCNGRRGWLVHLLAACAHNAINSYLVISTAASVSSWRSPEGWLEDRKARGSFSYLVNAKLTWPGFRDAMQRYADFADPRPGQNVQQDALALHRASLGRNGSADAEHAESALAQVGPQGCLRFQGEVWEPEMNQVQLASLRDSTDALIAKNHAVRMRMLMEDPLLVFLRQSHSRGIRHTASTIDMARYGDEVEKTVRRDGRQRMNKIWG